MAVFFICTSKLTRPLSLSRSLVANHSSKEIANFKNEIEKRQKEAGAQSQQPGGSPVQANQEEVDQMLMETMQKTAAGIPFEEQDGDKKDGAAVEKKPAEVTSS